MSRLQFAQGVAGTLTLTVPEAHGLPSGAASLTIYEVAESALTGTWPASVSLDSAAGTLDTAAEVGDESVSLGSGEASGFVSRGSYLSSSTLGEVSSVVLRGVDSATDTLYLGQPLTSALAVGSTIQGASYSYSLTTAQTATRRRRLRAVWTYTAGGVARRVEQRFDVVRAPFELLITESDLERQDAWWGEYAGGSGRWRSLVSGAVDDLERALLARQIYPDLLMDRDMARDAAALKVLQKFYIAQGQLERATAFGAMYDATVSEIEQARLWYDADDDGVLSSGSGTPLYDSDGNLLGYEGGDEEGSGSGSELGIPGSYFTIG